MKKQYTIIYNNEIFESHVNEDDVARAIEEYFPNQFDSELNENEDLTDDEKNELEDKKFYDTLEKFFICDEDELCENLKGVNLTRYKNGNMSKNTIVENAKECCNNSIYEFYRPREDCYD